jgi:hypothetical protein
MIGEPVIAAEVANPTAMWLSARALARSAERRGCDVTGANVPREGAHHRDHPADLMWDGTGTGVRFTGNHCAVSLPPGLCH